MYARIRKKYCSMDVSYPKTVPKKKDNEEVRLLKT